MSPEDRQGGFERLGPEARVNFRMFPEDQPITLDIDRASTGELEDWRRDRMTPDGQPMPWKKVAELVGIPHSTLAELVAGKHKGSRENQLREIDRFLAEDREGAERLDIRQRAETGLNGEKSATAPQMSRRIRCLTSAGTVQMKRAARHSASRT